MKRCSYYETCATYGLNVDRVFQEGEHGDSPHTWEAGNGGAEGLGYSQGLQATLCERRGKLACMGGRRDQGRSEKVCFIATWSFWAE